MEQKKEVKLGYKELYVSYVLDNESVADLATKWNITWDDCCKSLRSYGIAVRKSDKRPSMPETDYNIVLVDTDKIVEKKEKVTA